MITCAILNDINTLYQPDSHHTVILYPDTDNYEILHIVLKPLIVKLRKLKEKELNDN